MVHPRMYNDHDPVLARVRRIARDLPAAAEQVSNGRPAFDTVKVFAHFGGSVKVDGAYEQRQRSLVLLLDLDARVAPLGEPDTYVRAYLGPAGWVGIDFSGQDWVEVAELLDSSYRGTAPSRRVAELDARDSLAPIRRAEIAARVRAAP